ncbi:MAG TPA: hypothetical protein VLH94_01600 [Spirochaetia bacterium]|nr:hypothetical protein [Spirochaetia bacterium]
MTEDWGLSPEEVFRLFLNPRYVLARGEKVPEEGVTELNRNMTSSWLGKVVLSAIYFPKLRRTVPVILLTKDQMDTLRKKRVRLFARKRRGGKEGFICFLPDVKSFRKIISL